MGTLLEAACAMPMAMDDLRREFPHCMLQFSPCPSRQSDKLLHTGYGLGVGFKVIPHGRTRPSERPAARLELKVYFCLRAVALVVHLAWNLVVLTSCDYGTRSFAMFNSGFESVVLEPIAEVRCDGNYLPGASAQSQHRD